MFAPAARREALFALYALNVALSRIGETVSQPMLGEIRLQWWRESLDGIYAGTPRREPVVEALAATVAPHNPPRALFAGREAQRRQSLRQRFRLDRQTR